MNRVRSGLRRRVGAVARLTRAALALPLMTLLMHADPARANLADLAVFVTSNGTELALLPPLPDYAGSTRTYRFEAIAWTDTAMVTVTATAATFTDPNLSASVHFLGTDADPNTEGFQVALSPGANTTTVQSVRRRGNIVARDYRHVLTIYRPYTTLCHRTAAVSNAINRAVPGENHCALITDAHLAGITELDFTLLDTRVRTLASGDFAGLTGLRILDLSRANRRATGRTLTLPADIFDGLTSLEELDLAENHIPSLPAGVFDDLTALTELNCELCFFASVPANTFSGPARLQELRLDIAADTLPAGIFDGLTALTTLKLSGDAPDPSLTSIRADIFDDLTALETLEISDHALTTLPADIFDNLTRLTTLYLNFNTFTSLPAGLFDRLTGLTQLHLYNNRLAAIAAGQFDALTRLTYLGLQNNRLQTLPDDLFQNLTALENLDLSGNPGTPTFLPTALAGVDRTVEPGTTVTLDATASGGPWGTNVTYAWTQTGGTSVTLAGANTATPSFTTPASTSPMTFELTVAGVSCEPFCVPGAPVRTVTSTGTVTVGDATMSALALSDGTLQPAFDPAQAHYIAGVRTATSRVSITATPSDSRASVKYFNAADTNHAGVRFALTDADTSTPGFGVHLALGRNVFEVEVTGRDGRTKQDYTVEITRGPLISTLSTDATLSALDLSEGTLNPTFVAAQGSYFARVPPATARITVTPTANDADATVAYLDADGDALADADTATEGFQLDLATGAGGTLLKVQVTAPSGHQRTYEIRVHRNPADARYGECDTVAVGELFCAQMRVEKKPMGSFDYGYANREGYGGVQVEFGSLSQESFTYRGRTVRVNQITYNRRDDSLYFNTFIPDNTDPRGGLYGDDNYVLEITTGPQTNPTTHRFDITSPGMNRIFSFDAPSGFTWTGGEQADVRFKRKEQPAGRRPYITGPPAVSPSLNGNGWKRGRIVEVTLTFDKKVFAISASNRDPRYVPGGGRPSVDIELGGVPGNTRRAQLWSGSTTKKLTFLYQLQASDGTHHAIRVVADSLRLNGGTIMDFSTPNTAASPNSAALLGHPGVLVTSPNLPCESYDNELWCATLTVSSYTTGGRSALGFTTSGGGQGSLTNTQVSYGGATYAITGLTFNDGLGVGLAFGQDDAATVFNKAGFTLHLGNRALAFPATSINANGRSVTWTGVTGPDWSANDEVFVRLTGPPPSSSQIEVTTPSVESFSIGGYGGDGNWSPGNTLRVELTFDEAVEVDTTNGTPSVQAVFGYNPANQHEIPYASGSGTQVLAFEYTLASDDGSHNSVLLLGNSLATNGGTIQSVATGGDAALEHDGGNVLGTTSGPRGEPARASFHDVPNEHDGQNPFEVNLRFSNPPQGVKPRDAARILEITNGTVTEATAASKGANPDWEITIEPDGQGDVTVRVPTRECTEVNAVCIGGQPIRDAAEATVPGPQTPVVGCPAPALTGGARLVWTGQIGIVKWPGREYYGFGNGVRGTLDDRDFTVGTNDYLVDHVTQRGGAAGPLLFSLESALTDDEKATLTLHACEDGKALRLSDASAPSRYHTYQWNNTGGLDWSGETERTLHLVQDAPAPTLPDPIVATWDGAPQEHDGATTFTVQLNLDPEPVHFSYRSITESIVGIEGGAISRIWRRIRGKHHRWGLDVTPSGNGPVTLTVNGTTDCAAEHAVCTAQGGMLEDGAAVTIIGPALLSVVDAEVEEGPDAKLAFEVRLSRALNEQVTVQYATSGESAREGDDYVATSGTLTFAPNDTTGTVEVTVNDDGHNEGSETMTLTLSNPTPARVKLGDATATGTITNSDPMPRAWITRFGRTVGSQVVDALTGRLEAGGGSHVTVGGMNFSRSGALEEEPQEQGLGLPEWDDRAKLDARTRSMTLEEIVRGTRFHLSSGENPGGASVSAWGHFVTGGFDTKENGVTLDGDVTTGLLGADARWDRLLAGIMVSWSEGDGSYRLDPEIDQDEGKVESRLTGFYPYLEAKLNERVSAWGLVGFGSGALTLRRESEVLEVDLGMRMGAIGMKGQVLDGSGPSGIGLKVKSDAMWVETKSDSTEGMVGTQGEVSRLRLIVQGERQFELEGGATFVPSAELGLRVDDGDAETGAGIEMGVGARYARGALSIEGQFRALVAHEASGYEEWGASGALRVNPSASGRGLSLSITPVWGKAGSRTEGLWSARDARDLEPGGEFEARGRIETELGYGIGVPGSRGVVTPYTGLSFGEGERSVRAGTRWSLGEGAVMGLEGTRHQGSEGEPGSSAIEFRTEVRW